jgi:hypothetical protein
MEISGASAIASTATPTPAPASVSVPRGDDADSRFGDRELLVLQLLGAGYSPAQVSALVVVSPDEVARAARHARERLGAASVSEAIAVGRRRGLIL